MLPQVLRTSYSPVPTILLGPDPRPPLILILDIH
jgi:hypothetical protein